MNFFHGAFIDGAKLGQNKGSSSIVKLDFDD